MSRSAPTQDSLPPVRSFSQPLYVGVDEAGRGPLAGPVAVAGVILDPHRPIEGLNDSKKLSAPRRSVLYHHIKTRAIGWHILMVDVQTIDRLNIFQATLAGMAAVINTLSPPAATARVDGKHLPTGLSCRAEALIGGDRLDQAIMAASILAKVERDQIMQTLHARYPQYHFDQHKGYPTPAHLAALERYGPCPVHRHSYAPVRKALATHADSALDLEQS